MAKTVLLFQATYLLDWYDIDMVKKEKNSTEKLNLC